MTTEPETNDPETSPEASPETPPGGGAETASGPNEPKTLSPGAKLLVELGPLLVFFVVLMRSGDLFLATGVLMVGMTIALAVSWRVERRLPPMSIVTAVLVLVLGGLTIWLGNETFIKLKPTIVSLLFACVLAAGLFLKRPFLKTVLGSAFALEETGWRKLTVRWIAFFVTLALMNEVARRQLSTESWATFKVFGVLGLTIVFGILQMPLIQRYEIEDEAGKDAPPAS